MSNKLDTLTVKQLIELLSKFPGDTPVICYSSSLDVEALLICGGYDEYLLTTEKLKSEDDLISVITLHTKPFILEGDEYNSYSDNTSEEEEDDDDAADWWKKV